MRCSARSVTRTGWKVPAPTCSVRNASLHAPRAQPLEQRLVEVQPRRRRGDRARRARVHGLVARFVVGLGRMRDVGRQRHARRGARAASSTDSWPSKRSRKRSPSRPSTVASSAPARRRRAPGRGAWLARICASASRAPTTRSISTSIRPPLSLRSEQPRLDDARVVEDQHVARREETAADRRMRDPRPPPARGAAAGSPVRSGAGCCAISAVGQVEVEVLDREALPWVGHSSIMPRQPGWRNW